MLTPYSTIVPISVVNQPGWQVNWPGDGRCGTRLLYYLPVDERGNIPRVQTQFYESSYKWEEPDRRHLSGIVPLATPVRYFMTPRSVARHERKRYLLKRMNGFLTGYKFWQQYGSVPYLDGQGCVPEVSGTNNSGSISSTWWEVTHDPGTVSWYYTNEFNSGQVMDAIQDAMDEASVEALTRYDFLTEIAEAREIPLMVRTISEDLYKILRTLSGRFSKRALIAAARLTPAQLLKHPDRILRKLGDEWMTYRYGIMPLVYSYRDIVKLTKRGINVTTRKRKVIDPTPTNVSLPSSSTKYGWTKYVGNKVVSATVFQHFDFERLAQLSGLGLNPLATAWELIPYSFVIDWFVNVGDYISRQTAGSFASLCQACISLRTRTVNQWFIHYPADNKTVTCSNVVPYGWWGSAPPAAAPLTLSRPEENQLYREDIDDCYDRWLFDVRDAQLRFKPNLNWRRLVDSAVMALNQLRSYRRSLR